MRSLIQKQNRLTAAEFEGLADVPPELEWFADIQNENTRRAYQRDIQEFCSFVGIDAPVELRTVARAHVIAWRKSLEERELAAATIRRKLAALSALFGHLCECNAVAGNPVRGVSRPNEGANVGKTPALGDAQARKVLEAPPAETKKGKRDRAILCTLLYHGLRREELCKLRIKDIQTREGVMHFAVRGKGDRLRYVPVAPQALRLIEAYLAVVEHGSDRDGPLFRPVRNNRTGTLDKALHPDTIYKLVRKYGFETGINLEVDGLCVHSMRATAATNALTHDADIAKVRDWLGHADISTTTLYDKRDSRPEDSPTFQVKY